MMIPEAGDVIRLLKVHNVKHVFHPEKHDDFGIRRLRSGSPGIDGSKWRPLGS